MRTIQWRKSETRRRKYENAHILYMQDQEAIVAMLLDGIAPLAKTSRGHEYDHRFRSQQSFHVTHRV